MVVAMMPGDGAFMKNSAKLDLSGPDSRCIRSISTWIAVSSLYLISPTASGASNTLLCLRNARQHALGEVGKLDELLAEGALGDAAEAAHALRHVGLETDAALLAVIGDVDAGLRLLLQHVGDARFDRLAQLGLVHRLALLLIEQQGAERLGAREAADVRGQNAFVTALHGCAPSLTWVP